MEAITIKTDYLVIFVHNIAFVFQTNYSYLFKFTKLNIH